MSLQLTRLFLSRSAVSCIWFLNSAYTNPLRQYHLENTLYSFQIPFSTANNSSKFVEIDWNSDIFIDLFLTELSYVHVDTGYLTCFIQVSGTCCLHSSLWHYCAINRTRLWSTAAAFFSMIIQMVPGWYFMVVLTFFVCVVTPQKRNFTDFWNHEMFLKILRKPIKYTTHFLHF